MARQKIGNIFLSSSAVTNIKSWKAKSALFNVVSLVSTLTLSLLTDQATALTGYWRGHFFIIVDLMISVREIGLLLFVVCPWSSSPLYRKTGGNLAWPTCLLRLGKVRCPLRQRERRIEFDVIFLPYPFFTQETILFPLIRSRNVRTGRSQQKEWKTFFFQCWKLDHTTKFVAVIFAFFWRWHIFFFLNFDSNRIRSTMGAFVFEHYFLKKNAHNRIFQIVDFPVINNHPPFYKALLQEER